MKTIAIRGARTHNLKNIDVDIQTGKITCISGPSGSGKTSLAFHTLLTESKRRYLNSFPNDFKFFWDIPQSVDVDDINPVLPAWGLPQHNPIVGSRPIVADLLGLHEDLQKVFHLCGSYICPEHQIPLVRSSLIKNMMAFLKNELQDKSQIIHILIAPSDYKRLFGLGALPIRGYSSRSNSIEDFDGLQEHWEILRVNDKNVTTLEKRFVEEFPDLSQSPIYLFLPKKKKVVLFRDEKSLICQKCDYKIEREFAHFYELSAYNPIGACSHCDGHGMNLIYDKEKLVRNKSLSIKDGAVHLLNYAPLTYLKPSLLRACRTEKIDVDLPFDQLPSTKTWKLLYEGKGQYPGFHEILAHLESKKYKKNVRIYLRSLQKEVICESCNGSRISTEAHSMRLLSLNLSTSFFDILTNDLSSLLQIVRKILATKHDKLNENAQAAIRVLRKMLRTLETSDRLGLGHLNLNEKVRRLPPGEYQRILLSKFLSFEGSGSLLVLDEVSLGLNRDEQLDLMKELRKICQQGNTILVIDHSRIVQSMADELIVMGPGAGHLGGEIVSQGKAKKLSPKKKSQIISKRVSKDRSLITFKGLKYKDGTRVDISLIPNEINIIHGASSSLRNYTITKTIPDIINHFLLNREVKAPNVSGIDFVENFHFFNGDISRMSSRSTVGTITGLSQYIRKQFASLAVSKALNLTEGHFSSFSPLGQCSSCEGKGIKTIDMKFLEDIQFSCDDCKGMKLKPFYSTISNGIFTFAQMMSKPLSEVLPSIKLTPKYQRIFKLLEDLNLDYLELDRSLASLSGGERLRIKLLSNLGGHNSGGIYFFENLSFGLSEIDLEKMGDFLRSLVGSGGTVVLIDESEELAQVSTHFIDLRK